MSAASDPPPPYQAQDPLPTIVPPPTQRTPTKIYHVYRTGTGNYRILLDDKTPAFYVNIRTLRSPDMIVHKGNGDYDQPIASCKFSEYGHHHEIKHSGQVSRYESSVQTKMTVRGRFTATVPVTDTNGATVSVQRPFVWQQTSGWILIDEETSQTAAVVHGLDFGLTRWSKCFVLEIQDTKGYAFEVLALTSVMALYETKRRVYPKSPSMGSSLGGSSRSRPRPSVFDPSGAIGGSFIGGTAGF